MSSVAATIAEKLLQINAIKLSPQKPFIWASGKPSPIYCDNRITLSYPDVRDVIIEAFVDSIRQNHADVAAIVGVATAGIPHGALIAAKMGLPFAYVRSKPKAHGRQNQIEGKIDEGSSVVMIEDLISTGGSSLKAVDALRQANIHVLSVHAIFEYGFPLAASAFELADCPYFTLSNFPVLLEKAIEMEYITNDEIEIISEWRKNFTNS